MDCSVRIKVPAEAGLPDGICDILRLAVIDRLNKAAQDPRALFYGIYIGAGEWRIVAGMFIDRCDGCVSTRFEAQFRSDELKEPVALEVSAERGILPAICAAGQRQKES